MPRLAQEKIEKIHELAKTGAFTYKLIAEKVGCSPSTAKKYAEQVEVIPVVIEKEPGENPSTSLNLYDCEYSISEHHSWPAGAYFMSCTPKLNIPYTAIMFGMKINEFVKYCEAKYGSKNLGLNIDSNTVLYFYDKEKLQELVNECNRRINFIKNMAISSM